MINLRIVKIALSWLVILTFALSGFAQTPLEERQALEKELKVLEEALLGIEKDITRTQQEKKTLQNQISLLRQQIDKLNLQIKQSNIVIKDLTLQIKDTESSIDRTSLKVEDVKTKLANILQLIYQEDQKSLFEVLLSSAKLSDFFDNLMQLETLNLKSQEFLEEIKRLKSSLENQKQALDEDKMDLEKAVQLKTLQKQESESVKKEKDYYLKLTESEYQEQLKKKEETQKIAAQIRARIFELIGVPEAPTFGDALAMAKYVESITGVRPAFLLAVLTQESNIGKNVGQCYLKNPQTGAGVTAFSGKEISQVMKPSRDVQPFLAITQELGRDPYNTPVSCPMSFGWGGAMGPGQFIPSTWLRYKDRVREITGKTADPWNIKDAFLAAALYLADYGAAKQTAAAEWKAAMIYFSGSTNLRFSFYGDSVIKIAQQYESDIKKLTEAG